MTDAGLAAIQSLCVIGTLLLVRSGIAPYLRSVRSIDRATLSPRRREHLLVLVDIWLPLALVAPLIACAIPVEHTVRGTGWLPIGAPISIALLLGGVALLANRGADRFDVRRALPWALASVLLLLLGAAHVLEMMVGQVYFAIGAIMLWIVTPPIMNHPPEPTPPLERRAGWSTLAVIALSVLHAVIMPRLLDGEAGWTVPFGVGAMLTGVVGSGVIATMAAGRARGVQIAGTIGMLGVFFGVGMLALVRMLTFSVMMLRSNGAPLPAGASVSESVAAGFERFAFEATGLMALAVLAAIASALPSALVRVAGVILIAGGVMLWLMH